MSRRIVLFLVPLVVLFLIYGQPKTNSLPNNLPPSFSERLDSLKKADNLFEWLYAWREYVSEAPAGRVQQMRVAQSQLWRACRNDEERTEYFSCLSTQGYYLMYSGDILRSIDAYEEAYRFYFDKPVQDADVLEYVLKPLGNNYTRLGDYERAAFIHKKALSLCRDEDDSASVYNNLAIVERSRGELDSAKLDVEKGLNIVTENTALNGLLLSTLAAILFEQKDIVNAEQNISKAIDILKSHANDKESGAAYWLLSAYRVNGDVSDAQNRMAEAASGYEKALALIDSKFKGERKREKAQVLVSMGNLYFKMQQQSKALAKYDEALSILINEFNPAGSVLVDVSKLYGEYTLLDALHGKANVLAAMNNSSEALDHYMLFFIAQKKLRHEFFSRASKQLQQQEYRQVTESALAAAYDLWQKDKSSANANRVLLIAELGKAQLLFDELVTNLQYNQLKNKDSLLDQQQQMLQAIAYYDREKALNGKDAAKDSIQSEISYRLAFTQKKLREKYPSVVDALVSEDLPVATDLLRKIPSGTTALEYFTGTKHIYIIEATQAGVVEINRLDSALIRTASINEFVKTWFKEGASKMVNNPRGYFEEANKMYSWLWPAIKENHDQVLIIPDGMTGYVPFDALITDAVYKENIDDWPFLVKREKIYYAYSLQTSGIVSANKEQNKFAGFFISFDDKQNESLPAVEKERKEIEEYIDGSFYINEEANLQAFGNELAEANVLHISTHSFLQGSADLPVIKLSDQPFFLFDLYGKNFQPQLIVLSACRTGSGILAEGEGVISLARGFAAAGAGGVVAGLWNVNDESTSAITGKFYKELASKHTPAEALHASKIAWLNNSGVQKIQKLPYYWAGLVYTGNNEVVEIEKRSEGYWLWIVGGVVVLLVILIFRKVLLRKKMLI